MKIHLNHIGIAVADLPKVRRLFEVLGLEIKHLEEVPDQGVRTHFIPLPEATSQVELLEPVNPQGPVAQFIEKRGPGIHHLSFEVPSGELEPLCARLRAEGYKLIYADPRAGAHGMRMNFLHPSSSGGLLVELMEPSH